MPEKAAAQAPLQELLTKVRRILDIEERRERRRKWHFLWSILHFLFYLAVPVGVGYAMVLYFEDIFPVLVSKITNAMQHSLTTGAPPKIEITEDLLRQLKGMLGQ